MPKPSLTEKDARSALRGFFREKPLIFFGTGVSCSLDSRFGMGALKDALLSKIDENNLNSIQKNEWNNVKRLLKNNTDLESSLNDVTDSGLIEEIVLNTGSFIAALDKEQSFRIAKNQVRWPATEIIKKILEHTPETDRVVHVITPNYDMLFEYACESAAIEYTNGFIGGIHKKIDWYAATRAMQISEKSSFGKRTKSTTKNKRHIRLYKVHGSLNYFYHSEKVIENNAWAWNPPDFTKRVIITPGISKYEMLQLYRKELLSYADDAIEKSNHFLFIGYGFNDNHLEEYIRRKLITHACHGLIITRGINDKVKSLIKEAENLWVVCAANEEHPDNTLILNNKYENTLEISRQRLWDIQQFTNAILGE